MQTFIITALPLVDSVRISRSQVFCSINPTLNDGMGVANCSRDLDFYFYTLYVLSNNHLESQEIN